MAPSLRCTEAEAQACQQRQHRKSQMHALNEEAWPATGQPPSIATNQLVNGGSTARTIAAPHDRQLQSQPENLEHPLPVDAVNPAAHAATTPHDRQRPESATAQATVPHWWSRFLTPVCRMIRAMKHPQPAVVPVQQNEAALLSMLGKVHTANVQMLEQQKSLCEEFGNVHRLFEMMKEECSMKVEEVSRLFRSEVKREAKKEKVKQEEEEGKPKKPKRKLSEYNFHLKETFKRLRGEGMSRGEKFQDAGRTWKEMSSDRRVELYADLVMRDKERHDRETEVYHRELDGWRERRGLSIDERKPAAKSTPEELVTTAVTDHLQESSQTSPAAGANSFAGETNSQEGAIHVPDLPPVIAFNSTEAALNNVAAPPICIIDNHRYSQAGDRPPPSVWDENTHNSHPISYEQGLLDSSVGDENLQGPTPSVATNKRKNDSSFQVCELEGYNDGTPLQPGHVWVEYESGVAVQVKRTDIEEKLPPRNSRRKLSHNLIRV